MKHMYNLIGNPNKEHYNETLVGAEIGTSNLRDRRQAFYQMGYTAFPLSAS
jgi:hypothetical protein